MTGTAPTPSANSGMQAAKAALRVLEAVAELQPAGVSAIARALGMPKSSVQRCLVTLHEAGWLARDRTGGARWVLTGRALAVGMRASPELDLREAAHTTMRELRDETRETVHLVGYGGGHHLVIVDRLDSDQPVRTWVRLGVRVPLHASSSGRAVLAHLPDTEVDRLLDGELERFSEHTPADREAVAADLRAVRELEYATNDRAWRPGVGAVAAALLNARRCPVGAIAVSVPAQRYDAARAHRLGPLVAEAARRIGDNLPRSELRPPPAGAPIP